MFSSKLLSHSSVTKVDRWTIDTTWMLTLGNHQSYNQQHKFIWRKTILTFEVKLAPAMAQIALRKTAGEGESLSPHAAKTLKSNSYMDDILDSIPTEQ